LLIFDKKYKKKKNKKNMEKNLKDKKNNQIPVHALNEQSRYSISCIESRIENNRSFYGSFFLGPFLPGQSLTIANALRRTLLSDLKGIAIVSVQIQGVPHEYSSMPGVRDSVLDILLNMKEIVLKNKYSSSSGEIPSTTSVFPQIGYLHAQGPGIIRAGDLKLPPFIQVVDPTQYIATLAQDGALSMKFLISEGKSFMGKDVPYSSKQNETQNLSVQKITNHYNDLKRRNLILKKIKNTTANSSSIGDQKNVSFENVSTVDEIKKKTQFDNISKPLHIDAVFSPITKVNYVIEYSEHKAIDSSFSKSQQIKDFLNLIKPLRQLSTVSVTDFTDSTGNMKTMLFAETPISEKKKYIDTISQTQSTGNNFSVEDMLDLISDTTFSATKETNQKNYHNVVLEIWTNGSLHPKDALIMGLKELNQLVSDLAGHRNIAGESQNFDLQQFKYERNYQKLDLLLNTYTSYSFLPLNNSSYSTNYSIRSYYSNEVAESSYNNDFDVNETKVSQNQNEKKITTATHTLKFMPMNTSTNPLNNDDLILENKGLMLDISSLNLSLAVYTVLKRNKIHTVGDLINKTKKELLIETKLNLKTLEEIEKSLAKFSFKFK
jgi:DNA-directed RNA polymerase alpha subunit